MTKFREFEAKIKNPPRNCFGGIIEESLKS
jgi:hypothetical protein